MSKKRAPKPDPKEQLCLDAAELVRGLAVLDALITLRHDERATGTPIQADGEELLPDRNSWVRDGAFSGLCDVVPLDDLELTLLLATLSPSIDDRFRPRLNALTTRPGQSQAPLAVSVEALRNLAGRTLAGRRQALAALDERSLLHRARLIRIEPSSDGVLASQVLPTDAALELLAGVPQAAPELQPDFPATRLHTGYELDDLVVAPAVRRRLEDVLARIRNRSIVLDDWAIGQRHDNVDGLTVLLHGPPGTGKTMTAAVLADELGLPALRVDLSSLVSKYIGETAKNLERVFQHAEQRSCLLFFDEADSVFGRRGEVTDARDRYANQEVSYLLQRIEQFPGIVVLATNLLANIDQAFIRRIDVLLELAAPDANQRIELWERVYPDDVPQEGISYDELGEHYRLTGAQIKGAALEAAFTAAGNGGVVTSDHLHTAVKAQFAKSGLMAPS